MQKNFADTSFFVALLNPNDELHSCAQQLREELGPFHLVTSEMVLTELLNDSSARGARLREAARDLVDQIREASRETPAVATIVPQTPEQFEAALAFYKGRADKEWSLTDCASCLVMREQGMTDALTHDRHFEQMGFRALLRHD